MTGISTNKKTETVYYITDFDIAISTVKFEDI